MEPQKSLYYFGYGANMSKEYLQKRRRVFPTETLPGTLNGYSPVLVHIEDSSEDATMLPCS